MAKFQFQPAASGRTCGSPKPFWALFFLTILIGFSSGCRQEPEPPYSPPPVPPGMVLIPGGTFQMGSQIGDAAESPIHQVKLDAFYLDQMEVTNRQFRNFVEITDYQSEGRWDRYATPGREGHPVVSVTWNDAVAYARWAGKRLPTEAEWEYAARGGRDAAQYACGGEAKEITSQDANFGHLDVPDKRSHPLEGIQTVVITSYPPNPFGLYDMAGNVAEWCADWYDPQYYRVSPETNPPGPAFGRGRVVRGGSWNEQKNYLRISHRMGMPPGSIGFIFGFRCAQDVPKPPKPKRWLWSAAA